ncbi:hypothetical protein HY733_02245 [Candidatus Uhrbacteria bacterium]|nr:hypothetical protein [Candidatus Uhrbacteria bacterium]
MRQTIPKLWIFFFLVVLGIVAAILVTSPAAPSSNTAQLIEPEPTRYATFEQMLERGDDAIYVENQPSGQTFVQAGFVVLSKPGYIVIFDDRSGVPGSVIGESELWETGGEHLVVSIDEPLSDGQVYYAVLYHDDGNNRFRLDEDSQALDAQQSVVLMTFLANTDSKPETKPIEP